MTRNSSGSSCCESSVEPARSQNMTVSWRRSALPEPASCCLGIDDPKSPFVCNWEMAACSFRLAPRERPIATRSSSLRSGSTLKSISLSTKASTYLPRPMLSSHVFSRSCKVECRRQKNKHTRKDLDSQGACRHGYPEIVCHLK